MSLRCVLLIGCSLAVASPALASGGKQRGAKAKRMKVTAVVDKKVDGVVVERKIFLRSGGRTRKAKKLSLESKVKALAKGKLVSDRAAPLPASLSEKGRLVEKEGSYRERSVGALRSAVITLVRPGAHHFSGPEAKVVYSGGRARRVVKATGSRRAPRNVLHSQGGVRMIAWDTARQAYFETDGPASLSAAHESSTVHVQGERNGLLLNWDVDRQALEGALEHGRRETGEFVIQASEGWVTIQARAGVQEAIGLERGAVESFLHDSQ